MYVTYKRSYHCSYVTSLIYESVWQRLAFGCYLSLDICNTLVYIGISYFIKSPFFCISLYSISNPYIISSLRDVIEKFAYAFWPRLMYKPHVLFFEHSLPLRFLVVYQGSLLDILRTTYGLAAYLRRFSRNIEK